MASARADHDMANTQQVNEDQVDAQQASKLNVKRVPETDMKNATYSFMDEDHTLGNLLRNQIVKNKHVEFCAYSVPHPSEQICNVRVQLVEADDDIDTNKVVQGSLKRISKMCDTLTEKFENALKDFKSSKMEVDSD